MQMNVCDGQQQQQRAEDSLLQSHEHSGRPMRRQTGRQPRQGSFGSASSILSAISPTIDYEISVPVRGRALQVRSGQVLPGHYAVPASIDGDLCVYLSTLDHWAPQATNIHTNANVRARDGARARNQRTSKYRIKLFNRHRASCSLSGLDELGLDGCCQ